MKKIFCLLALMIATVSLASAQLIGAYSFAKSDGTFVGISGGNALDLSAVKYVPADGDTKAVNEAVTFAYGADGLVTGTSLTDIKGLPLGFDFEFNGTQMKYFAMNGTGVIYLSDTESFQVTPSQSFNALTASASASSVPALGLTCNQSKVRITDATEISYQVTGSEGNHVFLAQYRDVEQATNFNGTTTVKTNFQVKLYEAAGKVEIILGEWTIASGTIPGVRIGLAGLNGDMLNLKGSIAAPEAAASTNSISSVNPSTIVAGTTYTFNQPAPCVTPTAQPTNLVVEELTSVSATGSFTAAESGVDQYLVVLLQGDATFTPADGETYAAKDNPAEGVYVLAFAATNTYRTQTLGNEFLIPSTDYTVRAYAANTKCKGGPLYNLNEPAEVKFTTCLDKPASLVATPLSPTSVTINVAADEKGDQVVVAVNQNPALNFSTNFPESYGAFGTPTGTYKVGDEIEGGGRVVYVGAAKDGIVVDGFTPNQPVYVNAWSTDGASNYGTIYQEARTSTELQLPYAADYSNMGTYMEPAGYIVNDEYLSGSASVMTGADGHTATNGFTWKSSGAAGAEDMAEGTVTLPSFQIPANGARMSFDYQIYIWGRMSNSPVQWIDHALEVQLSENGTDYETIYAIDENNQPETVDVAFHTYNINKEAFAKYAGKKVTLRFKWSRYSDAYSFIQNIFIEEFPEIDYPTALVATNVDGGNVTIDWTDRYAEAAKWEVRYKKVEAEEWSEPVATTEKPYTVKGLDLSSTYTIQVRVVADEKVSPWADLTVKTGLGAPVDITFEALPFEDGWAAKQWTIAEGATTVTFTDDATTNWRFNQNYGLMYSGNYDRALVSPAIKLGDDVKSYTITITPGREGVVLKNSNYIVVSKDNGATWNVADAVAFDGSPVQMNLSGNVMVALCLAKGNTSFYIKGFSIEKTPSQFVLGPEDISTKKAYIIYTDARGGLTVASEDATTLSGTMQTGVGQEKDPTNVLQQFAFVGYEDTYYLYSVGAKKYVSATGLTEQAVNAIWFADADASTVRLLFDGSHNMNLGGGKQYLCDGWSAKDAGNSFKIEVAANFDQSELAKDIEEAVEQARRNEALSGILAEIQAAYAENDVPGAVAETGLITSADQFYSDYSDSEEGTSFEPLIDGDANTIWHSDWHGEAPEGDHSLEVSFPETIEGDIQLAFVRRSGKNGARNQVTVFEVQSIDEEGEVAGTTTLYLPFGEVAETAKGTFSIPAPTKKLRFVAKEITTPDEPCWNCAGFQLYQVTEPSNNSTHPDVAAALQEAVATAKAIENATQQDIETLVQAFSDYNVYITKTIYTYTVTLVNAPEDAQVTIGNGVYTNGQTVSGYEEVSAEDVVAEYEGYTTSVTVEDGVITVTYTVVEEVVYTATMTTADEINALAEGESLTLLLATSQKGQFSCSEGETFAWNNSGIAITDDELATTNENTAANTDKCRFVFTKTAEGFTIQNKDGKYVGYSGNTIVVGDTPMAWRVVCPQPGGSPNELLVNLDENNWLNNGIDVKYAVRIITSEGYWPQCNQAGLSQNLGGWTVLCAWNVTEVAPYVGPAKNQLFTATTPQRGGWMNVDGALKGTLEAGANVATDATDANQLFALVDYKGKTYLWNEGAQHFLNDAGQFVSILTATPIYCTEEAGYEGVCDKTYFFHFSEEKNINLGGSKQIIIDDWNVADAGNMMVINAAEGFNAEAVEAVIEADTYKAVTTITWTITDGEGNEIATETQEKCEEGKEYTVKFSLYGVTLKGETTVTAGKENQNITLVAEVTGTLPVEYAESLDKVEHWYALRLHSNQQHWLYNNEGALAFAGEEAKTDEYAWALVGDPIHGFQLYNKALGAAAALDAANPCTLSEDGLTARFYVYPTAEANHATDGFCMKAYGESQYLNYQGGAIKRWGAADAGSTFVFDEITAPTTYTYTIKLVNTPEDGAYLQIDGNWYSDGETVESETELTAEDVTVSCDPAYTYEVVIENGVITVTFKSATGINGINGDAKNAAIYSIQGQRILNANRGVNIKNGKKVLVK